jgi:collagen type VII alpha
MSILYINTGTSPNAGNGDVLRTAFWKVNNNFNYLASVISTATTSSSFIGFTGSRGLQGLAGPRGYWGSIGYWGSRGETGFTGSLGYVGSRGFDGSQGYTGTRGDLGFTGSLGYVGSRGYDGSIGYIGSRGDIGFVGSQGDLGYVGSRGYDGSIGYIGSQGLIGSIGYIGSQGFLGYAGSKGDPGGYTGSQGYSGSQGITGYTGSTPQLAQLNTVKVEGSKVTVSISDSFPYTIVTATIAVVGNPVLIIVSGDAENGLPGGRGILQLYRDGNPIGNELHFEGSAGSENSPYTLSLIDSPGAGTYEYSLKVNSLFGTTVSFGETDGPVLNLVELANVLGYTGSQGVGYTGSSGAASAIGYTGSQGLGFTGSQGLIGSIGYIGSRGFGFTGSQGLTGYTGSSGGSNIDLTTVTSHIIPSVDLTYDLGSTSSQWRSLYVGTGTIYIGGIPLTVTTSGTLVVDGNPVNAGDRLVNGGLELVLDYTGSLIFPDGTTQTRAFSVVSVPAASTSTGVAGDIAYNENYFYVCTATNAWQRIGWDTTPW